MVASSIWCAVRASPFLLRDANFLKESSANVGFSTEMSQKNYLCGTSGPTKGAIMARKIKISKKARRSEVDLNVLIILIPTFAIVSPITEEI